MKKFTFITISNNGAIYSLLIGLTLLACAPSQKVNTSSAQSEANEKPSWVKSRPIDPSYYIGISVINKKYAAENYRSVAKKNALFDLASEIKVTINSNSILYTIEKNETLKEEYLSNIKASTSQNIEGYELVANWENDNEYWVYYRLSKYKYKEQQKKKKDAAVTLALEQYKAAKEYESSKDILLTSAAYIKGLQTLEPYLGEKNEVNYEGQTIELGSRLSTELQKLIAKVVITPVPTSLTIKRGFNEEFKTLVKAKYYNKPAVSLPLKYEFITGEGELNEGVSTGSTGEADLVIQKVTSKLTNQEIGIRVDKLTLAKKANADDFMALWLESLPSQTSKLTLNVKKPVVYISSKENNLGRPTNKNLLKSEIQNLLAKEGFDFTQVRSRADMILSIDANTEKGTNNNGIAVSYLTANFKLSSKKDDSELYSKSLNRVKGVQLNYKQAGLDAYTNAIKKLKRSIVTDVVSSVF